MQIDDFFETSDMDGSIWSYIKSSRNFKFKIGLLCEKITYKQWLSIPEYIIHSNVVCKTV